jgi:hypothetical protein
MRGQILCDAPYLQDLARLAVDQKGCVANPAYRSAWAHSSVIHHGALFPSWRVPIACQHAHGHRDGCCRSIARGRRASLLVAGPRSSRRRNLGNRIERPLRTLSRVRPLSAWRAIGNVPRFRADPVLSACMQSYPWLAGRTGQGGGDCTRAANGVGGRTWRARQRSCDRTNESHGSPVFEKGLAVRRDPMLHAIPDPHDAILERVYSGARRVQARRNCCFDLSPILRVNADQKDIGAYVDARRQTLLCPESIVPVAGSQAQGRTSTRSTTGCSLVSLRRMRSAVPWCSRERARRVFIRANNSRTTKGLIG